MKKKKILTMITAVTMAAAFGATSLAGCNNNQHEHSYNYVTDYDATCTLPGQRTGTCTGCGNVKAEEIPVNPDAHAFDTDWEIDPPTEDETGTATRTCKRDPSHVVSAVLPKLSEEEKYSDVEETEQATILNEGKIHYKLEHSAGAIEFDITTERHTEISGIEDIVAVAVSKQNTVRTSDGNYIYGDPEGTDVRRNSFSNYYGEDYVHVTDGGNSREFWYSTDEDGKLFAISAEVNSNGETYDMRVDESVIERNLLGFGYASGGGMRMTYGAGDTLDTYYKASQTRSAIKYKGTYSELPGGGYECSFSFSRPETHFCRYYVEFTTFATGAIKTLSVRTKIIRSFMLANTFNGTDGGEVIYGSDGDVIFGEIYPIDPVTGDDKYETNYVYERDENGEIIYEPVYVYKTTSTGVTVYDDEGDPVIKTDENGDPVTEKNEDGSVKMQPKKTYTYKYTFKYEYETDASGNIVYDSEGDPVIKTDADGNPVYELDENGDPVEVIAKDINGGKIKYEVIGTPAIYIDGVKQKPDGTPLLDKNGNTIARPVPFGYKDGDERKYYYEQDEDHDEDHPYIAIRTVNFTQTLKVAGENVIENPYSSDKVYIDSFKVTYGGNEIDADETVEIPANTAVLLGITEVTPSTAKLEFDPIRVYLKTQSGEIALSYLDNNSYHIIGHFRDDNRVLINAKTAGTITIVLRTLSGKCEREITFEVEKSAPSKLTAQAYLYDELNGAERHLWTAADYDYSDPETVITLYAGQSLYVRTQAIATEADYVDTSFKSEIDLTSNERYLSIEDNVMLDGEKVSKITALEATPSNGKVVVYMTSVHTNSAYGTVAIKVIPAPSVNEMFTGTYTGRFTSIKLVETGNALPANVTVNFTSDRINVEVSDGKNTANSVYSYTYDAQTHALNCTLVEGRNDETFQFEFALNEVYKLTIKHPTILSRTETIVLSRPD